MKITDLVQTCGACPSQWEFTTDGDRNVYVRYRWGYLSVQVSREAHGDAVGHGPEIFSEQIGDDFDGFLEWEEVESRIKDLDVEEELAKFDVEAEKE